MGLSFVGGSTQRVAITAAASINTMADGCACWWQYTTSVANNFRTAVGKANNPASHGWQAHLRGTDGSVMRMDILRATVNGTVDTPAGTVKVNLWQFMAWYWSTTNNVAAVYVGTLENPARDVGATVVIGSGAMNSDSADTLLIGNDTGVATSYPGVISAMMLIRNRRPSLDEIHQIQEELLVLPNYHSSIAAKHEFCVGLWALGKNGTSTQHDLSGNGNHGTVTGATMAFNPPYIRPRN